MSRCESKHVRILTWLKGIPNSSPDTTMQCRRKRLSLTNSRCLGCGDCNYISRKAIHTPKAEPGVLSPLRSCATASQVSEHDSVASTIAVASVSSDERKESRFCTRPKVIEPVVRKLCPHHDNYKYMLEGDVSEPDICIDQNKRGTVYTVRRDQHSSDNQTSSCTSCLKTTSINAFLVLVLFLCVAALCSTLLCKNDSLEANGGNTHNISIKLCRVICRGVQKLSLRTIIIDNYMEPLYKLMKSTYFLLQNGCSRQFFTYLEENITGNSSYLLSVLAGGGLALTFALLQVYYWQESKDDAINIEGFLEHTAHTSNLLLTREQNLIQTKNAFLSADAVRDLMASYNRKRLEKVSDKALQYIEQHSSDPINARSCSPDHASFQEVPNRHLKNLFQVPVPILIGATSCLKVQYLFNIAAQLGEEWANFMEKCILERKPLIRVLHIYVCKIAHDEGKIYFKCASKENAGKLRFFLETWFLVCPVGWQRTDDPKSPRLWEKILYCINLDIREFLGPTSPDTLIYP